MLFLLIQAHGLTGYKRLNIKRTESQIQPEIVLDLSLDTVRTIGQKTCLKMNFLLVVIMGSIIRSSQVQGQIGDIEVPMHGLLEDLLNKLEGETNEKRAVINETVVPSAVLPVAPESQQTCCVSGKMGITLQSIPVISGSVPFVSVIQQTTGLNKSVCDGKILLKATFQRHSATDTCQGCTGFPQCGNKMLRIDLNMESFKSGFSFNVGDSRTNNGYKGDSNTQENDAEFHSVNYGNFLYGSDKCTTFSQSFTGLLSTSVTSITIYIGNEFIRVTNNLGYSYRMCSKCLFALNGQSDIQGIVNDAVYIGLNRIIDSPLYRTGTGVCSAVIGWTCPWCENK